MYYQSKVHEDVIKQYLPEVPEVYKEIFISAQSMLDDHRRFIKHPEWAVYNKEQDCKLYTRVSDQKLFCIKSTAYIPEAINDLAESISDPSFRMKFNQNLQEVKVIEQLPLQTSILYQLYKKVLVVSPRDVTVVYKRHQVSPIEVYIMSKSVELEDYPPVQDIVRAETLVSGCRIKQVKEKCCKVQFYSELDIKIALFLQKQVAPKSGHLAKTLKDYISKNPIASV